MAKLRREQTGQLVNTGQLNTVIDALNGALDEIRNLSSLVVMHLNDRQAQVAATPGVDGSGVAAMILSVVSSAIPGGSPGDNRWTYLYHLIDLASEPFDLQPREGTWRQPGAGGDIYVPVYSPNGAGWGFDNDDEHYRNATWNNIPWRGYAYNLLETYNSLIGVQGNGVDIAAVKEVNPNMDIQPVPVGTVVQISMMPTFGGPVAFFSYENGIDGGCGA